MMTESQAKDVVRRAFKVDPADIRAARQYITGFPEIEVKPSAEQWARESTGVSIPRPMPLWEDDPSPHLIAFANQAARRFAFYLAAWELLRDGVVLPAAMAGDHEEILQFDYTTAPPRGSGGGGGVSFPERCVLSRD
jgi:hypothetical protein